jgi:winged helix domain-containing protein/ATPase family protein associated with various cellular activities (AAA)
VSGPPGSGADSAPADDARALAALLDVLREKTLLLVKQRTADDPDPLDPWRGLRQTPDSVTWLLTRPAARDLEVTAAAETAPRMDRLIREFGLSALDAEILLIAVAPDLDRSFEACYGYLNDDVTRRRATVGLALELTGYSTLDPGARGRFTATAPLVSGNLLIFDETDRPYLTRSLRVPDRVVAYLLGDGDLASTVAVAGSRRIMGPGVRRVEPGVGWDDLVLPDEPAGTLRELVDRVRNRDRVLGVWGLRVGGGRGRGVTALFAGESGTGKTLAAEVVARELGLDLYVAELSALVDKYVGETEKNLERLFEQAERVNAVLLFDEADAIFGKRSETKDSHDRYANMESSYLLQRLESFDGVAILTTNLRGNIDDAFTRRFDLIAHFPFPDRKLRRQLWAGCLTEAVPVAGDIDLDPIAAGFELAGGAIRAAATTAAYLAAAAGRPVSQADLLAGARREYRKQGRLIDED